MTEPTVTNVDLTSMHLTCDRLASELLKSEVNGGFDQRHAAELHVATCEDLARDGARCANHEIWANTEDGIIGRLKEGV
jgi:hypothetical protein